MEANVNKLLRNVLFPLKQYKICTRLFCQKRNFILFLTELINENRLIL